MNAIFVILSCLINFVPDKLSANTHFITINLFSLFNGQFLFVMKFIAGILLVFLFGGIVGTLLHLDKVEDKSDTNIYS